jgi:hypothetical protein
LSGAVAAQAPNPPKKTTRINQPATEYFLSDSSGSTSDDPGSGADAGTA